MAKSDSPWPWADCLMQFPDAIREMRGKLWRMVESQEQVATRHLVDSLDEQSLLEELLEQTKPPYREPPGSLHYLLSTPFRYPPLEWGSRFGNRFEPSLFYGAKSIRTALAETAYYRLLFISGMELPPISGKLVTQHLLFKAAYRCDPGVRLQQAPFSQHQTLISNPVDYRASQALGTLLREQGVQGFEYRSARCEGNGVNAALFVPKALSSKQPQELQHWICETSLEQVLFSGEGQLFRFAAEQFYINGKLPQPA